MYKLASVLVLVFSITLYAAEKSNNISIKLRVDKSYNNKVEARISDVKKEGISLGIDNMILQGNTVESHDEEGNNVIKVIWNKAKLDKNEVDLEQPLVSEVILEGNLQEGDIFKAEGDPQQLIESLDKLKQDAALELASSQDKEADTEAENPQQNRLNSYSGFSASGGAGGAADPTTANNEVNPSDVTPNFQVKPEIPVNETADGCSLRIDLSEMKAYIQKRKMQGADEVWPCQDSIDFYPIDRDYKNCPDHIDSNAEKSYKQYRLVYQKPNVAGLIEVEACTPDDKKATVIPRDYTACGIKHDFATGWSWAQYKLFYKLGDQTTEVKGCTVDKAKEYKHVLTKDTCTDIVSRSKVLFYKRWAINVDGTPQYITACEPSGGNVPIGDEYCTTGKYDHDFTSKQSFVKKTYYYSDNNVRHDIDVCVRTAEVYNHKEDIDQKACLFTDDPSKKHTQLYSRTFIETSQGKEFIKDCHPHGSPIPYNFAKYRWYKGGTRYDHIKNSTAISSDGSLSTGKDNWNREMQKYGSYYEQMIKSVGRFIPYDVEAGCYHTYNVYYRPRGVWQVASSNEVLNMTYSDQLPLRTISAVIQDVNYPSAGKFICSALATCQSGVTTAYKRAVYNKYDGTEYVDPTNLATMHVCGTGSKIIGREEQ